VSEVGAADRGAAHDGRGGRGGADGHVGADAAPGPLPLGVQLVAAPFMEESLFRVAARLENDGVVAAPVA